MRIDIEEKGAASSMRRRSRVWALSVAAWALLLAGGCQTQVEPAPGSPMPLPISREHEARTPLPAPAPTPAPQPRPAVVIDHPIDDCAAQMHDLAGYLLQYYVVHGRIPETLETLAPFVDFDQELPVRCPGDRAPYLYFPEGRKSPTEARWLILADANPVHGGNRSAIVVTEPEDQRPLGFWVVVLTGEQFLEFVRR
jgi:hypothetical protein